MIKAQFDQNRSGHDEAMYNGKLIDVSMAKEDSSKLTSVIRAYEHLLMTHCTINQSITQISQSSCLTLVTESDVGDVDTYVYFNNLNHGSTTLTEPYTRVMSAEARQNPIKAKCTAQLNSEMLMKITTSVNQARKVSSSATPHQSLIPGRSLSASSARVSRPTNQVVTELLSVEYPQLKESLI